MGGGGGYPQPVAQRPAGGPAESVIPEKTYGGGKRRVKSLDVHENPRAGLEPARKQRKTPTVLSTRSLAVREGVSCFLLAVELKYQAL